MAHFFYRRSPRIIKELAGQELEIYHPPSKPQEPQLNIISVIIPVMVTVAGAAAMMTFYQSRGNNSFVVVQMISVCTMVASYMVPILVYFQNKNKYRSKLKKRIRLYEEHLNEKREILQSWKNELVLNWHQTHLDPQFCLSVVSDRKSSVWERIPQDSDFIKIRAGIGTVPSNFDMKVPKQESIEKEPLVEKAIELADRFDEIPNAPALLDLNKYRVVGLVGNEEDLNMFCRTLITQLATHHAPDEVKMSVFMNKAQAEQWDWIRWLPHVWNEARSSRYIFQERSFQPQILEQLFTILQRRQWLNKEEKALPFYICFLPFIEMLEYEPILPLMMKQADKLGVCSIVLADSKDQLPKECELVIDVANGQGMMRSTNVTGGAVEQSYAKPKDSMPFVQAFTPDSMTLEEANRFARKLAPYRMKENSADEIANVLTLFELLNIQDIEQFMLEGNWDEHRYPNTLPFPVGVKGGQKPVIMNLHDKIERKGHGPHGLMAGTTGSGKSEVIQSMIASLAVQYHPHDMAFMLIDYKGGGMSNIFQDLPHVIATITNLEEEGLIERSKISLKAELKRRQRLFIAAGNVQHIDEYYQTDWKERHPLPHLFIVIDEFAQLKKDQPEFMSELVSIAAIGRTLGVHLLLATQKPGGVVDDKIWSNSRYRVCLRVQDEGDSREMIRIPDAAHITNPGRGFLQVGSNEVFESVQFAWSGAPYHPANTASAQSDRNIYEYDLDGRRTKLQDPLELLQEVPSDLAPKQKQLNVLIDYIAERAKRRGINRLPGPWLEPLPTSISLAQLPAQSLEQNKTLYPKVGLVDDVVNQSQFPLHIDLETGHWAIYGMPGTGKTTFIQTLLYSMAQSSTPEDIHIYALDFGRMLKDYRLLPHVADVIQDEEEEKMERLFTLLEDTVTQRKILFSENGVKSRAGYREETGQTLPAIMVVIDSYVSFRSQFEKLHERLEPLLREGSSLGIYFVVTCNRVSDMLERVRSNFANAVTFMLADPSDYSYAVGRLGKVPNGLSEGRGFIKGSVPPYQFQTALALDAMNESSRAKQLREQFVEMDEAYEGPKPEPIRTLPDIFPLHEVWQASDLDQDSSNGIPLGIQIDNLDILDWNMEADGPYFTIGGRMESGKTSLLSAIGLMSAARYKPEELELYLCDFRRSSPGLGSLKDLNHTKGYSYNEPTFLQMLEELREEVESRSEDDNYDNSKLMLLIDDVDFIAKRISKTITGHLEYIARHGRDRGVIIVVAGLASGINRMFDEWIKEIKSAQVGWLLGTSEAADAELFGIKIPFSSGSKMLPEGEGYYIRRKFVRVKTVHTFADGEAPVVQHVLEVNQRTALLNI